MAEEKSKRILIIEDDMSIASLEQDYLQINGYDCELAEDGEKGLSMALRGEYDLIILDLMLPKLDGFTLLSRFRAEKDTPLIILSARKEDIDKVRGLGLGADDYMTKPFSPGELVARVKSHIARFERLTSAGIQRENVLRVRGLEINKDNRQVFLDGKERVMPAREYDLLLFLAEHPGRVFSKEEIFDRVWGMDAIGDVSTVTVHIKRIREKIETDMDHLQYIETVWGVGYRFKA